MLCCQVGAASRRLCVDTAVIVYGCDSPRFRLKYQGGGGYKWMLSPLTGTLCIR
jgi:hypothetical protein